MGSQSLVHRQPVAQRSIPCDCVFATAVLGPTRVLATCYWARFRSYGKPLVLVRYDRGPLTADSWGEAAEALARIATEWRSRLPIPMGLFVETDVLVKLAEAAGVVAKAVPRHLVEAESWQPICQSASGHLAAGEVGYTRAASDEMDRRPFLDEAGTYAGPRTDEPATPAFLYGVVLGLDEVLARDPKPRKVTRAPR